MIITRIQKLLFKDHPKHEARMASDLQPIILTELITIGIAGESQTEELWYKEIHFKRILTICSYVME